MSELLKTWGSLILGSFIIPASVAFFTGDAYVKFREIREEHSNKIVSSIQKIMENPILYYPLDTRLNNRHRIVPIEKNRIDELNYNEHMMKHLETGYPEISKKIKDYEQLRLRYLKFKTDLLEYTRDQFANYALTEGITVHYYVQGRAEPSTCIMPLNCAESAFNELIYRYSGWDFFHIQPKKVIIQEGDIQYYRLEFHNKILSKLDTIHQDVGFNVFFKKFFEEPEVIKKMDVLKDHEYNFKEKEKDLCSDLKKIVEDNDLGKLLKGKCDTCPKILPNVINERLGTRGF